MSSLETVALAWATVWSSWAEARLLSAVSRLDWACSRSLSSVAVCRVASSWPAFTASPLVTLTPSTVPATAKLTLASVAGSIVPVAEVVSCTLPMLAATVRYVLAPERVRRYAAPPPATRAAATKTATTAFQCRFHQPAARWLDLGRDTPVRLGAGLARAPNALRVPAECRAQCALRAPSS